MTRIHYDHTVRIEGGTAMCEDDCTGNRHIEWVTDDDVVLFRTPGEFTTMSSSFSGDPARSLYIDGELVILPPNVAELRTR